MSSTREQLRLCTRVVLVLLLSMNCIAFELYRIGRPIDMDGILAGDVLSFCAGMLMFMRYRERGD